MATTLIPPTSRRLPSLHPIVLRPTLFGNGGTVAEDHSVRWTAELLVCHPIYGARPSLRGRFHQFGAIVSVPLGAHLLAQALSAVSIAYVATAVAMFTTSAAYHRLAQSVLARFWMRRLDHSMIFVHMAGAATPILSIAIGGMIGAGLVVSVWLLALLGVEQKMTRLTADHDPCPWLFAVLGGVPLVALPGLVATAGADCGLLLVVSIALYAAGATCFVRKAPNPRPTVFGYHEIWHLFTLLGGACEFAVMVELLAR